MNRTALLIDLDNLVIDDGGLLLPVDVERVLRGLLAKAGEVSYCILAAPIAMIQRFGATLARLGLRWVAVPCLPDAADHALLEEASYLAEHGFNRFVLGSADHIFADLAGAYPTTVIVRDRQPVSWQLRQAAQVVHTV